jgi:hypothetical protein
MEEAKSPRSGIVPPKICKEVSVKNLQRIVMVAIAAICVTSCVHSVRQTDAVTTEGGLKGIFTEVTNGALQTGKVDLLVKLSIKTHLANYYLFESPKSFHGKPGYPFIFTVDGQTIVWREEGYEERTATYGSDGLRSPEGGKGRRYILEKRLRLNPGLHVVEIDLPEEPYACVFKVDLNERQGVHVLELRPTYRRMAKQTRSFLRGVTKIDPYLDSAPLALEKRG